MRARPLLFAIALPFLAACGTSYVPPPADPVLLATPQSPAHLRAAIVRALADRRFATESEAPGRVVARFDHGATSLHVAVEYADTQYFIRLLDSRGYKTRPGEGGVLVEASLAGTMRKLRASIDRELERPAREAAEAARREREYQLLLQQHATAQAQANAAAAQANAPVDANANAAPGPGLAPGAIVVPLPSVQVPNVNVQQSTTQGSQTITCCINGAQYQCPSQDAFRQCMSANPSACTRAGTCR